MQLIVVVVERGQKTLHTTLRYSISNLCMHFSDLLDLYPRVRVWVVAPTRIETHGIPCDQFNRSHAHAAANKPLTRHTNTERATAQRQRRLIVEVVVAAPKLPPSECCTSTSTRVNPRVKGALCAQVKRLRVSDNQNDETLSQNSLMYMSKANLTIAVN